MALLAWLNNILVKHATKDPEDDLSSLAALGSGQDHPHFIVPYQQESKQLTLNISHHATDGLILGVHYDVKDPLCSSHPAIYGWMTGYLLL